MKATPAPKPRYITLWMLAAILAWDASGFDMAMAHWFGDAHGFPLTDHWLLTSVFHQAARVASWLLAVWLTLSVWWPVAWLRRLRTRERAQLAGTTVFAVLLISGLKAASHTSCPWDMNAFGGAAHHVSHWAWSVATDGGSGHCFPAGHASSGFAFLGGYFVFRRSEPRIAVAWLVMALMAGFSLGLAQQIRGAHFMSHTLWTAWLCWSVALVIDWACQQAWASQTQALPHGAAGFAGRLSSSSGRLKTVLGAWSHRRLGTARLGLTNLAPLLKTLRRR